MSEGNLVNQKELIFIRMKEMMSVFETVSVPIATRIAAKNHCLRAVVGC